MTGRPMGIGIDLVDVERFGHALSRRPGLARRLFTDRERMSGEQQRPVRSLAARFAAKEAAMKALGVGLFDVGLCDIEVVGGQRSAPQLHLSGRAKARADALGFVTTEVSLTHTESMAGAMVVMIQEA